MQALEGGQEVTDCEKESFCCCVESKHGRKGHYCRDPGNYNGGLSWREVVAHGGLGCGCDGKRGHG